jgi:glutamine synthetase
MAAELPSVPTVRLEIPDFDHGLRGKFVRSEKIADGAQPAMCTIMYGLSVCDEVVDTPLSSAENGYPDAFTRPDLSTLVDIPWRPRTQAVIADMVDEHGELLPESPRTAIHHLLQGYGQLGLEPIMGFEYEAYVMAADGRAPLGRTVSAYSLLRIAEISDLADVFMARMEAIGSPIEAFHSELGPGFFEFALAPAPALQAADRAARARQVFRELCAERGLLATFMAKLHIAESGSGGHVHQSLNRDGVNVFSDGPGRLSPLGSSYVAGLVASMGDLTLLFNPYINSYKRLGAAFFVAIRATWGLDNRNAACRTILTSGAKGARVEHRRPGADASPYLVAAGMLAGGLYGLRGNLDPGPPLEVGADVSAAGSPLPASLNEAISVFEHSTLAREYLSDRFVDTYVATRKGEQEAFDRWFNGTITDWELNRYPEHL